MKMTLLELFCAWFQIGIFSIGGGYAALPLVRDMAVDRYGWLTAAQFADLIVIDEMAPGPIILNSATFVGAQAAGLLGAVISTIGCLVGPAIVVSIIAYFYIKYGRLPVIQSILLVLRPVVVALIASAGISLLIMALWGEKGFSLDMGSVDLPALGIAVASLVALKKGKPNPVFVVMGSGVAGAVLYWALGVGQSGLSWP